jgi:hypothetical protein
MNQIGWEIRPLGWLILCVIALLFVYLLYKMLHQPPLHPDSGR